MSDTLSFNNENEKKNVVLQFCLRRTMATMLVIVCVVLALFYTLRGVACVSAAETLFQRASAFNDVIFQNDVDFNDVVVSAIA